MTKLIPRQYIPVLCVILSIVMSVLDGTIMNVALPTLTKEFGIEPDTSIWIVNAYQMVIMMFLLIFSALGDIYGYRKIFLSGTFIFTVASGLCVLSINFPMLIVSRILQGIGAACVMSVNTALIRQIYPPHYLGRGMSYNAMAVAISSVAGPTIAGFILSSLSWHWLFAINLPFGIIALVLGTKYLPANIRNNKRKIDFWSCAGNALTFGLLIYAVEGFAHKESLGLITFLFIAFLVIGFLYIRKQLHTDTPPPAGRFAPHSIVYPVGHHVHRVVHGTDAGHGFPAVLPARCDGILTGRNRHFDYTLATGYLSDCTGCRQTCRKSPSRFPRGNWHAVFCQRTPAALLPAGTCRKF